MLNRACREKNNFARICWKKFLKIQKLFKHVENNFELNHDGRLRHLQL